MTAAVWHLIRAEHTYCWWYNLHISTYVWPTPHPPPPHPPTLPSPLIPSSPPLPAAAVLRLFTVNNSLSATLPTGRSAERAALLVIPAVCTTEAAQIQGTLQSTHTRPGYTIPLLHPSLSLSLSLLLSLSTLCSASSELLLGLWAAWLSLPLQEKLQEPHFSQLPFSIPA